MQSEPKSDKSGEEAEGGEPGSKSGSKPGSKAGSKRASIAGSVEGDQSQAEASSQQQTRSYLNYVFHRLTIFFISQIVIKDCLEIKEQNFKINKNYRGYN